ncbi:hypothetical protein [Streptobacillus canis]|uniref:hypothetical protein n=1 Tax=Streptobacillus canis TaxID=2678686 RepID=UPI0012E22C60|nr:hypothetical protein [Streptobacillus canis]
MFELNKLVEVYFNDEFDKLSVGYIRKIDDEYIMLEEISPRGFKDGCSIISKNRINIVKSNTEYLKEIEINGGNIFDEVLEKLISQRLILTIELKEGEKVFGFVQKIDEENIYLEYFQEKILVKKRDVINFYINGINQRRDVLIDNEKRK